MRMYFVTETSIRLYYVFRRNEDTFAQQLVKYRCGLEFPGATLDITSKGY